MQNGKKILNVLNTFDVIKTKATITKKLKTLTKKIKNKKIKTIIKFAITSTKVICETKTLVIVLTFHNLII